MYLVIHNDHVSTEEVVVCNDASEPLGGWVLSIHTYTVAIQWVGTWKQQETVLSQCSHSSAAHLCCRFLILWHTPLTVMRWQHNMCKKNNALQYTVTITENNKNSPCMKISCTFWSLSQPFTSSWSWGLSLNTGFWLSTSSWETHTDTQAIKPSETHF